MQNTKQITQLIGRAALAAVCFAPVLGAQQTPLFTWRGTVDDDVRISMRAGNIQSQIVRGSATGMRARVNRSSVLPRRDGTVRVETIEGRGTVRVIQQPSAANRYTAIIQVKDARGGAAPYRFATYFEPTVTVGRRGRIIESVGGDVDLASGSPVLRWRGNVDGTIQITMRGGRLAHEVLSGASLRDVSSNVLSGGLPARDARLSLAPRQGRGTIAIVQRPASSNGYTAIIRVSDAPSGYGYYDFDVIWR